MPPSQLLFLAWRLSFVEPAATRVSFRRVATLLRRAGRHARFFLAHGVEAKSASGEVVGAEQWT